LLHFVGRQTCAIPPDGVPPRVRALKVHHVSFLAELHPGDDVEVIAKRLNEDDLTLVCAGQLWKGPTLCALVIIEGVLLENPVEDSRAGT
jgi:hypothetical protein